MTEKPLNSSVLIIQRHLTHYRVPFFEALRSALAERDISLRVGFGSPTDEEIKKNDSGHLSWAEFLPTRYFYDQQVCWQPFGHLLGGVDLVVVTAENKLIYNLWMQSFKRSTQLALWGHGANLQGDPASLRERFKRRMARRADWWFAYTELSVRLIEESGFPRERITILDNAVDTSGLIAMRKATPISTLDSVYQKLGLEGGNVGISVGSIYHEKRIKFLLDAALLIRQQISDFELLIVGAGEQEYIVKEFCKANRWARYLGVLRGQDKVNVLGIAKVMLNPGLVGLGILDSFACGVPMITTDCGLHSPEISYLRSGENGLMTDNSLSAFAAGVVGLLSAPAILEYLVRGCFESSSKYTLENMASNFSDGAAQCLKNPLLENV